MKHFFAGNCNYYIYLIDSISVSFDGNDPRVKVFSSKKSRDAYVAKSNACALPARIARTWIDEYAWDSECDDTLDGYLREYPQNDLRSL